MTVAAPLGALTPLLRTEPTLGSVLGQSNATLAVAPPAQAFVLAGLARLSERHPVLVVTATAAEAERMATDLSCFLDERTADEVEGALRGGAVLLPPWETLPFERVSPEVSTMGQRLAVLAHLLGGDTGDGPRIVVAPVSAVLQRLAPGAGARPPLVVTLGARLDIDEVVGLLVAAGYRREHQVEHRGELAVRGGIVDVFGPTADRPVRIDLFGDEVDRLTAFDIGDQRSVADIETAAFFGCRELLTDDDIRARAAALLVAEPWGRSQWERLAEGLAFDGMESWLPWLHPEGGPLTDHLDATAQVVLVEPRRIRDRAAELEVEESELEAVLAGTWVRGPVRRSLASTCRTTACSSSARPRCCRCRACPKGRPCRR